MRGASEFKASLLLWAGVLVVEKDAATRILKASAMAKPQEMVGMKPSSPEMHRFVRHDASLHHHTSLESGQILQAGASGEEKTEP